MENISSTDMNSLQSDSGAGIWASGFNDSGSGIINNRPFWLVLFSLYLYFAIFNKKLTPSLNLQTY